MNPPDPGAQRRFLLFLQVYMENVGYAGNNPCFVATGGPFLGAGGPVLLDQHPAGHL